MRATRVSSSASVNKSSLSYEEEAEPREFWRRGDRGLPESWYMYRPGVKAALCMVEGSKSDSQSCAH